MENTFSEARYPPLKEIFTYTFKTAGKVSSLDIFGEKAKEIKYFQRQKVRAKSPLLPPFNELWQMATSVRTLLIEIPPQEITIKVFGDPYVFYYLFRMLSWLPQKHSFSLESNFRIGSTGDFLIRKMNDFVLSLESNFKQINLVPFPTNYIVCKECSGSEHTSAKQGRKLESTGIDIVIPTKNVPQSQIEECIASVLPQLQESDVIYLVDDNENDSEICKAIIEKFSGIILVEGSRRGIGATRNIGAKIGSNPLIAFVDSDDYILSGYLELQRKFHFEYLDVAATGTWIESFGAHELIYPQWDGISPISMVACLPPAGVLMWKREAISSLSYFNEDFTDGFEDFDLVSRAVANQLKIFVVDIPLYRYRRGHMSLSQGWTKDRETELQSKVAGNLQLLCTHEFKEYLELSQMYGDKLLLSHPDFVFGSSSILKAGSFRYFLNKMWVKLFQRARNVIWLRRVWNGLNPNFRMKIVNFLIK